MQKKNQYISFPWVTARQHRYKFCHYTARNVWHIILPLYSKLKTAILCHVLHDPSALIWRWLHVNSTSCLGATCTGVQTYTLRTKRLQTCRVWLTLASSLVVMSSQTVQNLTPFHPTSSYLAALFHQQSSPKVQSRNSWPSCDFRADRSPSRLCIINSGRPPLGCLFCSYGVYWLNGV